MKKTRYLILLLVFACLGLTSFTSAGSITYTGHYSKAITSSSSSSNGSVYFFSLPFELSSSFADIGISSGINNFVSSVSCSISNLTNSAGLTFTNNTRLVIYYLKSTNEIVSFYTSLSEAFGEGTLTFNFNSLSGYKGYLFGFSLVPYYSRPNSAGTISFDYSCVVSGNDIGLSSGSSDCPTCEVCQDCSSIQNAYETLSGYYATCQSNLSICQGSLSGYDSCQGSLGACLEDNISLENMNESLSSQLEACLLNGGNGCDPEVDTGCITGAFQVPLLSWSVGLDSFTTPIINNLTLPTNYKGKLVDGVLTISSINNNLSISDSDMDEIKDSIVEVAQYIFRLALMLVIIYYIKFYLFNTKK